MSVNLHDLTRMLDIYFEVGELKVDPSMKIFFPRAYKYSKLPIETIFESRFLKSFNGLMISGNTTTHKVFTASFPHKEILKKFIQQSQFGDLLFVHHPIPLECGNPNGHLGRGFLPLDSTMLLQIINKKLSIYSLHAPLDYHPIISTNRAIVEALSAEITEEFLPYGNGNAGLIVTLPELSTTELIDKVKRIFSISHIDFAGIVLNKISKVGIVAGGGDDVEYFKECEKLGCQAYLSGEITSRQNSRWAKTNMIQISKYAQTTSMSLIGVSHSASEFLVMKTQIKDWISTNFSIPVVPLTQDNWWI